MGHIIVFIGLDGIVCEDFFCFFYNENNTSPYLFKAIHFVIIKEIKIKNNRSPHKQGNQDQ